MDLSAIGRQFGLTEEQTRAAMESLAPVVAAGMRRNAQSPEGLQDIFSSVLTGNRARALEDENAIQFDNAKPSGDEILGQIFGSKDTSREVAQQLSATSGIGAAVLKKLLPIVASIVMGQVAKKMGGTGAQGGGGLGDILGDILGGGQQRQQQQPQSGGGGLGDILKDVLGGGAQPQQQPEIQQRAPSGQGGSLEDILGEILNGGKGGVVVKQIPQDQMGDILKDIFGGNFPGGAQPTERYQPPEEAVTRGRKTLDDVLGGGTRQGSEADILLDSVERSIRRR
jgi:hypothetical protein